MSSRLFQILCDLVSGAQAAPKCPQYTRLQRGLHVEVMFDGEVYRLRLWRDSGTASDQDWLTVLQNWPWKTWVEPTRSTMARPPYMQGYIAPSLVQEKLL